MYKSSKNTAEQEQLAQMIRVNHAGEFGAKRIYAGQLDFLKDPKDRAVIEHMLKQEEQHFNTFDTLLKSRAVRPTALMPIWHVAGYALGAITACMGSKAAYACTVAVESVIDEHYKSQEDWLATQPKEAELATTVTQFRAEELEHKNTALAHEAEDAALYQALSIGIQTASKIAIWLSKRI